MDIVETILNYGQNWIQVSNLTQLLLLTLLFLLLLEIVVALFYPIPFLIICTRDEN